MRKVRRFWVYCVYPGRLWGLEVTWGFEGNYEHEYFYGSSWQEMYDQALRIAKTWRYPEGWMP